MASGTTFPAVPAAGSETTIVIPPPGVSSGVSVPPMASTSPRDNANPRPTPVVLSRSPRRWNGVNIRSQSSGRIPEGAKSPRRRRLPLTSGTHHARPPPANATYAQ